MTVLVQNPGSRHTPPAARHDNAIMTVVIIGLAETQREVSDGAGQLEHCQEPLRAEQEMDGATPPDRDSSSSPPDQDSSFSPTDLDNFVCITKGTRRKHRGRL